MWTKILIFFGGVAAGSVATYLYMKDKTEERIYEEVEDVRRTYARLAAESAVEEKEAEDDDNDISPRERAVQNAQRKADMITSSNIIARQSYNLFSKPYKAEDEEDSDDEEEDSYENLVNMQAPSDGLAEAPYTISQFEFINGEPYYDKTTLNYYDDDILEEELTEGIIEDINAVVGRESLTKFGEYEDDVVFVRNEKLCTDYEIIHQHRNFADIPKEDSE